jgi:hypothetical protein
LIRNNGKEQHHALPQYSMEEFNEPIGIDWGSYHLTPSIDWLYQILPFISNNIQSLSYWSDTKGIIFAVDLGLKQNEDRWQRLILPEIRHLLHFLNDESLYDDDE